MLQFVSELKLTFGGIGSWRRVAVARVFTLVVQKTMTYTDLLVAGIIIWIPTSHSN
jgi:hypothetical protein